MDFKEIREKCVERETVLVDRHGDEHLYICITPRRSLVTENFLGVYSWPEDEIKDWRIKPEPKEPLKLYAYQRGFKVSHYTKEEDWDQLVRAPRYDIEYTNETK